MASTAGYIWVLGREFESHVHHEIAREFFLNDMYVQNLKNASGSPEIETACGGASTRKTRFVPGGDSIMRLRLGRRLVNF